jgi:hypothetical protein
MIEIQERPAATIDTGLTADDRAKLRSLLEPLSRGPLVEYDAAATVDLPVTRTAMWSPASSRKIRVTEDLLIAGVITYFCFGLLTVFGVF